MKKLLAIALISFLLTSCGQGFENSADNGSNTKGSLDCVANCSGNDQDPNGNNNSNNNGNQLPAAPELDLDGKVSGGIWDGKQLIRLDMEKLELVVRVPIGFEAQVVGGSIPIPGKAGLVVDIVTDDQGETNFEIRVPLGHLIGDTQLPMPAGLPNGDNLPMVPGGKLPHIGTMIGGKQVDFFLGKGITAMFVPLGFDPPLSLVFPIKNQSKENIGHIALIGKKGNHKGGVYVSLELPDDVVDALDTWLPLVD